MAVKSSIVIDSISLQGNKGTKAVPNINPDAGEGTLESFADKVMALSTNNYNGTTRVDKTDLDAEAGTQVAPTLTLGQSSATFSAIKAASQTAPFGLLVDINYNGDGKKSCGWSGKLSTTNRRIHHE